MMGKTTASRMMNLLLVKSLIEVPFREMAGVIIETLHEVDESDYIVS